MKRLNKYAKLTAIICLLLLGIIQLTTPTAATENIGGDPFKDPLQWETSTHGDAQVTRDPGFTITSSPNYEYSGAEVYTTWQFIGDFDVQVDYSGVGWNEEYAYVSGNPHLEAAVMGVITDDSSISIKFMIDGSEIRKSYTMRIDSVPSGQEGTCLKSVQAPPNFSGKFRIIRKFSDVEFQYFQNSYWFGFYSITNVSKPASIFLGATSVWTNHTFSTIFENFQINSGETNYVPLVWKDTFPNRTDFIAGGIVIDSLWQRTWENKWKEVDPIQVLRENGVEWVRVLVDITKSQELSDTPPEQWSTLDAKYDEYYYSREYVEQIMREAQNLGFHLYLMYSLTTAQGKPCYDAPEVWKDLNATELAAAVEEYTYDTTKYYQSKGLNIEIYEISGENENGFLGFYPGGKIPIPEGVDSGTDMDFMRNYVWNIGADLLKSAIKGVRRADTDAKIVIHATGFGYGWSKDEVLVKSFFQAMIDEGVDFDYAGLTHPYAYFDPPFSDYWYPNQFSKIAWFQHMKDTISHIAGLGKKVIFSEAGYPPSSDSIYCDPMPDYPFTPEGQAAWLHDELLFATNNEDVVGFFYYLADSYEDYFRLFASETQPQPAMKEFLMGRTPAAFELSRLTINPTQAEINSPITVSTEIKNTGGISGFYDAALKLNGIVEESKRVLLNSDTQTTVNFNVTKAIAGSYSVEVGSLSGSFIVRAPPRPAAINLKSLVISKALVKSGEEVTVNATLENIGEQSGTYALVFNLDGVQKDSSTVSLDGGKTVTKTIKFSSNVEGTHTVTVGGESVTFDVEKVQMGIPGYPIESVLIGVILVIIILTLYSRKRASRNPGKPSLSLASKVLGEKHSLFID